MYWCITSICDQCRRAHTRVMCHVMCDLVMYIYDKASEHFHLLLQSSVGKKVAVDHLSFNMFKGQITSLLGHNGAGMLAVWPSITSRIGAQYL